MKSLILKTTATFLLPLILLFSLFLLIRGHHDPGGGFAGGLVASGAFGLYAIAFGTRSVRRMVAIPPFTLMALGLFVAMFSGFLGLFQGKPFLTGVWGKLSLGAFGDISLGTPLFFDVGVYLVVLGVLLSIFFSLMEAE